MEVSMYVKIIILISFRIVHIFAQKYNFDQDIYDSECHWLTYNLDLGKHGSWIKRGVFKELVGYAIGMFLLKFPYYPYFQNNICFLQLK